MGLALTISLGLMGCPVEDEDTDGSVMMMGADAGAEDPLAGLGADCVCEEGEFICMSTCQKRLGVQRIPVQFNAPVMTTVPAVSPVKRLLRATSRPWK